MLEAMISIIANHTPIGWFVAVIQSNEHACFFIVIFAPSKPWPGYRAPLPEEGYTPPINYKRGKNSA
jgi:hypothetical protein